MGLTSVAIRRPVFIVMVVSALIVLGLYAKGKMRLELNPQVELPYVTVVTIYPGAGPEEIETQVTKKVEDAVASVNGIKNVSSASQYGQSVTSIEFNIGVRTDVAAADVREKVSGIRASLPRDSNEPIVQKFDINSQPIIYYGLTGKRSARDLRDLADNTIKPRLSQVSGVAAVSISGGEVREIRVSVHKDRLDAYGIGIQQLVSLLQANTLNFPVGRVVEGEREYDVRVVGEFRNVVTIGATRLRMPNGQTVQLADIADVLDTVKEKRSTSRIDETDSVGIVVQKTSEGNTVEVAAGIKKEITDLERELPKDVRFVLTEDSSVRVEEAVEDVQVSLFLGAFLAIVVIFLFLHNIRGTFIVALAIPTSLLATFLPVYGFGFTLNTMTMMALSLAVGILVDDSIVVLENIYRHLSKGEPPVEASINGRSEIGMAAVTITLVDVVVFVPIAFMGGIVGQFFKAFGITVAVATLFSLFMSFTLTPMLASRWYRAGEDVEGQKKGLFGMMERFYGSLDRVYRRALEWALRYRGIIVYAGSCLLILIFIAMAASVVGKGMLGSVPTLIVVFVVLGLMFLWPYRVLGLIVLGAAVGGIFLAFGIGLGVGRPLLQFRFAPNQDQGQISVTGELPAGTAIDRTIDVVRVVEKRLKQSPEVKNLFTVVGSKGAGMFGTGDVGPQFFGINVKLRDKMSLGDNLNPGVDKSKLRKLSGLDLADSLRKLVGDFPDTKIKVAAVSGFRGGAGLQIDIRGQDIGELTRLAKQALVYFKEAKGAINADITTRLGKPEQRIEVDREKAASFGLSVSQIAMALRSSLEGNTSGDLVYRENGNEYDIRVQFSEKDRQDVSKLANVIVATVPGPNGATQPVRLGEVAHVVTSSGPTRIDRLNRQRLVSVTADIAGNAAPGNLRLEIDKKLAKIDFGANTYEWGGENKMMVEEGRYMMAALGLAIILVYMLMAALFDSLIYPLVIMLSLPMALVGALLGLMMAGHSLSIVAMIGIIMLVGLVTKNAILLVDYTNTLRSRGKDRTEAILEAGPTRLRPILMTTIAMVFGMLPTALGLGRGAEFRAPLATPVIGGLILSTMLTLLVIPCVYTYFDDMSAFIGRLMRRGRA